MPRLAHTDVLSPDCDASAHLLRAVAARRGVRNVSALLALPHVRAVSELDGFAEAYTHVTGDLVVRGNLVPDAHLAAVLFQHGIRTATQPIATFASSPRSTSAIHSDRAGSRKIRSPRYS